MLPDQQDDAHGPAGRPGKPQWTTAAEPVEVVAGFDGALEVVVLRRSPGGPWLVPGTDTVVDPDSVARLTGRIQPVAEAAPVAEDVQPLRDAVTAWLAEYSGPPLQLTAAQAAFIAEAYTDLIAGGQLRHG